MAEASATLGLPVAASAFSDGLGTSICDSSSAVNIFFAAHGQTEQRDAISGSSRLISAVSTEAIALGLKPAWSSCCAI